MTFLFLQVMSLCAQSNVSQYPIAVSQIAQMQGFVNPSMQNQKVKWSLGAFSKLYTGMFQNNNLSVFSASTRITKKRDVNFHNLGMVLYYDKEGNYLNRYRTYMQYAYVLKLKTAWFASFGASIGAASYKIGNESYVSGGQDNALDGNIGLSFWNEKSTIGVSALQIPQGRLQPLQEMAVLRRYYNVFLQRTFDFSGSYGLRNSVSASFFKDRMPSVILSSGLLYEDLISISLIYSWGKSLGFMFGLETIKINKSVLRLYVSYDINVSKSYKNNSAELTLKYGMPYKAKVTKVKK